MLYQPKIINPHWTLGGNSDMEQYIPVVLSAPQTACQLQGRKRRIVIQRRNWAAVYQVIKTSSTSERRRTLCGLLTWTLRRTSHAQPSAQLSGYNFHLLTRNSRQRGMFYFFKVEDWCSSWSSNILATWCEELTHWKRRWCWERVKAGGEGDDRGRDGWMASPSWLSEHEFEQIPG